MKVQSTLFLLLCVAAGAFACSTGGGDPFATPAGGGGGAASGSGGNSSTSRGGGIAVPEAGDLPDSALEYEAAAPDSTIFHVLTPDFCDSGDLCCDAFEWPVAAPLPNILLNTGAYVKQDGKLYQYVGTQTITWPQQDCSPKKPVRYDCMDGKWWKDMGVSCPAT